MLFKASVPNTWLQSVNAPAVVETQRAAPSTARYGLCECGGPRTSALASCVRCRFLEGGPFANVVEVMRERGSMTIDELAESTGRPDRRWMSRTVKAMIAAGRMRRVWDEYEIEAMVIAKGSKFGDAKTQVGHTTCGRWVYYLTS